jgi:DNA-binding CsgD family transcriptional regulator
MDTFSSPKSIDSSEWINYFNSFKVSISDEIVTTLNINSNAVSDDKVTYFVFDLSTLQNSYLSDNFEQVTGHPIDFGKKGFEFLQATVHPDDFERTMLISKRSHEILMNSPLEERKNAKLRMNYRFKHPTKGWIMILHQACFKDFTAEGLPALAHGFLFEINDFAQLEIKIGVLELENGRVIQLYSDDKDLKLTNRETDILKLAQIGLASKNIADTLKISVNTVNNIRATLLKKTGTKNIAELIASASKQGLI